MSLKKPFLWDTWIKQGESLFSYMISNFEDMFEENNKIKHFDIYAISYGFSEYIEEFKNNNSEDFQNE